MDERVLIEDITGYTLYWKGVANDYMELDAVNTEFIPHITEELVAINDRIATMKIRLPCTQELWVFSVYTPTIDRPEVEKESCYEELQKLMDRTRTNGNIILLGDLNVRVGRNVQLWNGVTGYHGFGKAK